MNQPLETQQPETAPGPELLPLLRLLRRASGFALAFLKCNVPTERERVVRVLSQSLKSEGRSGRLLRLREPVVDLLEEIHRLEPPLASGDVLFVLGFERSIPPEVDFPPALVKLNLARELFRDLPCALIIVLPDYALTQLVRQAPDFWAWRSGVFEVEVQAEELATILQRELQLTDRELGSLSLERIRTHLEVLLELLAEYEAHENSDREILDLLRQIASDLRSLGDLENARAYAERAVELSQKLGDQSSQAEALNILAVVLADLGRFEEALGLARRAVEVFRSLPDKESVTSQEGLATSLSNLGAILGALGRSEEALKALDEAVELGRLLAAKLPDKFLPELAAALNNLGTALRDLGRREEALAATEESTRIRRRLVSERARWYLPDLAASLNNLGVSLSDAGRQEEALAAVKEAVKIYRRVAPRRPEVFSPSLASSLNNLGAMLGAQGRSEEAVRATKEAVHQYRRVPSSRRDGFLRNLATSQENLVMMRTPSLQFGDIASKRFVLVRGDLPARSEWEMIETLSPERVIARCGEGADATYYLLTAPEALSLFGTVGDVTASDALAAVAASPVPALDASLQVDEALNRGVVLDQGMLVGFFDLTDIARGWEFDGDLQVGRHRLAAEMEGEVALGQNVSLLIFLAEPELAGDPALPMDLPLGAVVDVYVRSRSGFELEGPREARLIVTEEPETLPVQFRLRAVTPGVGHIEVLVFYDGVCLGRLALAPTVTRGPVIAGWPARFERELYSGGAPDSDLTLLIHETSDRDKPALLFRLRLAESLVHMKEFGPIPLRLDPSRFFTHFFQDLEGLGSDDERAREKAAELLKRKGAELFENVFPRDLQALFWSLRQRIRSLRIESEEPWIPWELCRLVGREEGRIEESGFFCEEFVMARWILGIKRKSSLSLRRLGLIAPSSSGSEEERRHLSIHEDKALQVEQIPCRYLEVVRALASGTYDGIHFSGHGYYRDHEPNRSSILLDEGEELRPEDLSGKVGNLGLTSPLVFLNASQTGRASSLTGLGGWAPAFLRAGASAFIGTLWEVSDRGAEVFARTFYQELFAGKPIGEAVRQARFAVRNELPGNPDWMAYTLFADPLARIDSGTTPPTVRQPHNPVTTNPAQK